jgi:hypothetical protein
VPYTWLLDAHGRVVAAQPGEVEWLAPATRALLLSVGPGAAVDSASASRPEGVLPRRQPPARLAAQALAVSTPDRVK